jgi:hypothetical protein
VNAVHFDSTRNSQTNMHILPLASVNALTETLHGLMVRDMLRVSQAQIFRFFALCHPIGLLVHLC